MQYNIPPKIPPQYAARHDRHFTALHSHTQHSPSLHSPQTGPRTSGYQQNRPWNNLPVQMSSIFPKHVIEFLSMRSTEAVPQHIGALARSHTGVTILFMVRYWGAWDSSHVLRGAFLVVVGTARGPGGSPNPAVAWSQPANQPSQPLFRCRRTLWALRICLNRSLPARFLVSSRAWRGRRTLWPALRPAHGQRAGAVSGSPCVPTCAEASTAL